jgi:hypothetical protein
VFSLKVEEDGKVTVADPVPWESLLRRRPPLSPHAAFSAFSSRVNKIWTVVFSTSYRLVLESEPSQIHARLMAELCESHIYCMDGMRLVRCEIQEEARDGALPQYTNAGKKAHFRRRMQTHSVNQQHLWWGTMFQQAHLRGMCVL